MGRGTAVTMETHAMLVEAMPGMHETGLLAHVSALTWSCNGQELRRFPLWDDGCECCLVYLTYRDPWDRHRMVIVLLYKYWAGWAL